MTCIKSICLGNRLGAQHVELMKITCVPNYSYTVNVPFHL